MRLFAHSNGHDFDLDLRAERDRTVVRIGDREIVLVLDDQKSSIRTAFIGDRRLDFGWDRRDGIYSILIEGIEYRVTIRDPKTELLEKLTQGGATAGSAAESRAPIPGLITRILCAPGESVKKGQPVLCLDAMKLENEIGAPQDGTVQSIDVRPGQAVEKGQRLFVIG